MQVGLHVPKFTWPEGAAGIATRFGEIARTADQAGVASLSVMDHFFQIATIGPAELDMLEAYTTLGYAAAITERITLGTIVTGVTYRHPGLLVKTATTLDVLSRGRAYFGIGAAWNEEEHVGLGVEFPPTSVRFERLEETLEIALRMWKGDESRYEGKHYTLGRPLNSPQPIQRPHPPIMIGGSGERKTLRLVAKYADACNIFDSVDLDEVRHKLDVLRRHCDDVGRPYDDITKTTMGRASDGQSADEIAKHLTELAGVGIDRAVLHFSNIGEPESLDLLTAVTAKVADVVPAGR